MKWEYNRESTGIDKPAFRLYLVKNRQFNLLFTIEDLQGDGIVRLTIIILGHAFQFVTPFNNERRIHYEWRLFK